RDGVQFVVVTPLGKVLLLGSIAVALWAPVRYVLPARSPADRAATISTPVAAAPISLARGGLVSTPKQHRHAVDDVGSWRSRARETGLAEGRIAAAPEWYDLVLAGFALAFLAWHVLMSFPVWDRYVA